ncbi:uncharacterized protein BO97DRAFT_165036 [Aspergillus homomorphus CBS 101889]|uniref:Uncharacterized protein n=1 Tax=Aspergillus homomorphus (strain CBS 101889) TaxID=1450537 RepID=A0A395HNI6_ASPHC|nr:hypothetical protein BO97DRAFT_165036 [Aspergillus homomorphus CBS 101889]RAL09491.1 hypothetical protein BO97DRAFT_165036 [Aspergillus homomorphus CBS 101889]
MHGIVTGFEHLPLFSAVLSVAAILITIHVSFAMDVEPCRKRILKQNSYLCHCLLIISIFRALRCMPPCFLSMSDRHRQ